jgi:hypothetical protein
MDTYWVNIAVIWSWIILTYIALYFRPLKKVLDSIEESSERKKAKS